MLIEDFLYILENLEINPLKLSGKIIIRGTRIPLHFVLDHMESGWNVEDLLDAYPTLSSKLRLLRLIRDNIEKVRCIHNMLERLRRHLRYREGVPYIRYNSDLIDIRFASESVLRAILKKEIMCLSKEEVAARICPKIVGFCFVSPTIIS